MNTKISLIGFFITLACGALAFARYSLDAIFSGGFSTNLQGDFVNDNLALLVLGGGVFVLSATALLLKRRSFQKASNISPSLWYRFGHIG